jgi:hypothetical protein
MLSPNMRLSSNIKCKFGFGTGTRAEENPPSPGTLGHRAMQSVECQRTFPLKMEATCSVDFECTARRCVCIPQDGNVHRRPRHRSRAGNMGGGGTPVRVPSGTGTSVDQQKHPRTRSANTRAHLMAFVCISDARTGHEYNHMIWEPILRNGPSATGPFEIRTERLRMNVPLVAG